MVSFLAMDDLTGVKPLSVGEGWNVRKEAVSCWIERPRKLMQGHSLENVLHMDILGCLLKRFFDKVTSEKKTSKGRKDIKTALTVAFLVNAAGEKLDKRIFI